MMSLDHPLSDPGLASPDAPDVCDFIGCDAFADRDYDGMPACDAHATEYEQREAEGERQAELAVERFYEGGWDTTGEYSAERAY